MLALALASGGLAASRVQSAETRVEQQVGPLVPVVVARTAIGQGARVTASMLAVRQVPQRFAPVDSLASPQQAIGVRAAAAVAPGGYLSDGTLGAGGRDERDGGASIAPGERAAEVAVSGGETLAGAASGTRVDVLVTTDPAGGGGGRTYLALQDVELLAARAAPGGASASEGAAAHATTIATLRVTLRQAVYLTAAQSFAKEVRLLPRAPGDTKNAPAEAVDGRRL